MFGILGIDSRWASSKLMFIWKHIFNMSKEIPHRIEEPTTNLSLILSHKQHIISNVNHKVYS